MFETSIFCSCSIADCVVSTFRRIFAFLTSALNMSCNSNVVEKTVLGLVRGLDWNYALSILTNLSSSRHIELLVRENEPCWKTCAVRTGIISGCNRTYKLRAGSIQFEAHGLGGRLIYLNKWACREDRHEASPERSERGIESICIPRLRPGFHSREAILKPYSPVF